ncbi:MAG: hypothetical protein ACK4OO_07560, partial [bacterium]
VGIVKGGLVVVAILLVALWSPLNPYLQKARSQAPVLHWSLKKLEPFAKKRPFDLSKQKIPFLKTVAP